MQKLVVLFAFAVVAIFASTAAASAQELVSYDDELPVLDTYEAAKTSSVATPNLTRKSFNRLTINGQKFSFKDANRFIDSSETVTRLQKGLRLEKTAIGLGVSSVVFLGAGILTLRSIFYANSENILMARLVTLYPLAGLFLLGSVGTGIASIATGISGAVIVKKAIRGYNSRGFAQHRHAPAATLGFAVALGGLGMQLTF